MVRIMTGTLLEVGFTTACSQMMSLQFFQGKKKKSCRITAPAQGLCLIEVDYN